MVAGGRVLRVFSGGGVRRTTHLDPCRGWVNGAVLSLLPHTDNLFGGVGGDGGGGGGGVIVEGGEVTAEALVWKQVQF